MKFDKENIKLLTGVSCGEEDHSFVTVEHWTIAENKFSINVSISAAQDIPSSLVIIKLKK